MRFSFDPATIAWAREIILHQPNLDVLDAEREGSYSPLVRAIESELKKRDAAGMLLLPNLSALANQTIGIFSDYGGESSGHYDTYSCLICAYGSLGVFWERMRQAREKFAIGKKEIAFKDFEKDSVKRVLPTYLEMLNGYVSPSSSTSGSYHCSEQATGRLRWNLHPGPLGAAWSWPKQTDLLPAKGKRR